MPTVSPNDVVTLRGGGTTLQLMPALGGKLSSLHAGGREWLWASTVIPYRVPDDAARADSTSYVETADTGGYDECFPTVGPCTIPADVPGFGGLRLPDHGELWSQQTAVDVARDREGEHALTTWVGQRMPYRFERRVSVLEDGVVRMAYSVANDGDAALPFLWSAHPLLPLTDRTRVHLPAGAPIRVDIAHQLDVRPSAGGKGWPILSVAEEPVDLARPAAVGADYACKLFLDLRPGPVTASIEEDGQRLEVAFDGHEVTHFGLWINNCGWTPFEGGQPYRNLAFEPCIGAPDSLAKALENWDAAAWLAPRGRRQWSLTWRVAPA